MKKTILLLDDSAFMRQTINDLLKSLDGNETRTVNVSGGGVFVDTDSPLSPGQTLELDLFLPEDDRPLHCHARVVWNISTPASANSEHPLGMGLEFLEIDDDQRLNRFLQS